MRLPAGIPGPLSSTVRVAPPGPARGEITLAALRRIFDGVVEKVRRRLRDQMRIAQDENAALPARAGAAASIATPLSSAKA